MKITVQGLTRLSISVKGSSFSFCVDRDPHGIAQGIAWVLKPLFPDITVKYNVPHPLKVPEDAPEQK